MTGPAPESLARRTVLVTGVAGFLGRYVARHFNECGTRVVGFDTSAPENTPREFLADYDRGVLPSPALRAFIAKTGPDILIHCAGRASVPLSRQDPIDDFTANAVVTANLLEDVRIAAPECRVLFYSSAAVYGQPIALPVDERAVVAPISPYGFHKHLAETLLREYASIYGLRTASLRIFSAYGAGLRRQVLWDICRKAYRSERVQLRGTGSESRDFIHASDVARAAAVVAASGELRGECYNVASGEETSIGQLAEILLDRLESKATVDFDGVLPKEEPARWRADISRISGIGFSPELTIGRGASAYADWFRRENEW